MSTPTRRQSRRPRSQSVTATSRIRGGLRLADGEPSDPPEPVLESEGDSPADAPEVEGDAGAADESA